MFALTLKAELVGVTNLRPKDTEECPFWYTFTVQCTSCRETHPNTVAVSRFENNEMSGSRGEANFVWKCKNCKVWDTEALTSLALRFGQRADGCFPPDHSGSHRPQSRRHPNHTSRESRPSRRLSSILTAEDWNSPSFTLKGSGSRMASTRTPSSRKSSWRRASGLTTMKRPGKRSASRTWYGTFVGLEERGPRKKSSIGI